MDLITENNHQNLFELSKEESDFLSQIKRFEKFDWYI